jgi:hypothetical protein
MITDRIDVYITQTKSELADDEFDDEIIMTEFKKQRDKLIERLNKLKEFLGGD